jgi:hypothetical protein
MAWKLPWPWKTRKRRFEIGEGGYKPSRGRRGIAYRESGSRLASSLDVDKVGWPNA